jgi:hypothetical protein
LGNGEGEFPLEQDQRAIAPLRMIFHHDGGAKAKAVGLSRLSSRDAQPSKVIITHVHLGASTSRIGNSVCMTEYHVAARAAIIPWTNLAVMPAEILFDAAPSAVTGI